MPHVDEQLNVSFHNDGLHMRPCVYIVKRTARFSPTVIQVEKVGKPEKVARWYAGPDSGAIWQLFELNITEGDEAVFKFAGLQARKALEEVKFVLSHTPPQMPDKIADKESRRELTKVRISS